MTELLRMAFTGFVSLIGLFAGVVAITAVYGVLRDLTRKW